MKKCKKCLITKPLADFYEHKECKQGVTPKCKECIRAEHRQLYELRKEFGEDFRLSDLIKIPEGKERCRKCESIKDKSDFYKDRRRPSGVHAYCKACNKEMNRKTRETKGDAALEARRQWIEKNRERLREQERLYRMQNRDRKRVTEQRRRARKAGLPDTLTEEDYKVILDHFDNKCALCDSPAEAFDHFIPLATGCGGTVAGNIVPLCKKMNSSKHSRNPFEWADKYLSDGEKAKFDQLVRYLANANELTVDEYREFVFSCFRKTS